MRECNWKILSGTHLKLIAAFTMLLDHTGALLFPDITFLRVIGRLSYPLFAFMIAEGCRHTRHKLRYFLMVFGLGIGCQAVYYFTSGDMYLNILLTFSCSILLIYVLQTLERVAQKNIWACVLWGIVFLILLVAVFLLDSYLNFDYGVWGVLTPVLVSLPLKKGETEKYRILLLGIGLVLLGTDYVSLQNYALLALPLLLLYNGQRGKANLKYVFYIFYPAHLVVLQGIAWILR